MKNIIVVHVLNTFTDLSHEEDHITLSEGEVVGHHSLEQLPASDTAQIYAAFNILQQLLMKPNS